MSFGVKLKVWGRLACFTKPEFASERVSYDVMTPTAARGVLEAIYWKPEIRWVVDKIHVLNEIRWGSMKRNEVAVRLPLAAVEKAMKDLSAPIRISIEHSRVQRATRLLRDVAYVIEAHFDIAGAVRSNTAKHKQMFERRAASGQQFHQPYLGCREFAAFYEPVGRVPPSFYAGEKDLGWMLHSIDFVNGMSPCFFRAIMRDGEIKVPPVGDKSVIA